MRLRGHAPTNMRRFDAVIVGSGINSLVCAAVLAKGGVRFVCWSARPTLIACLRARAASRLVVSHVPKKGDLDD